MEQLILKSDGRGELHLDLPFFLKIYISPLVKHDLISMYQHLFSRWTRREEADFYRVVSTFGVVYDVHRQCFDWSQFRAFARLDKKTDESLEKYYYSFVAMCKRVCRMQVKSETGELRSCKKKKLLYFFLSIPACLLFLLSCPKIFFFIVITT